VHVHRIYLPSKPPLAFRAFIEVYIPPYILPYLRDHKFFFVVAI
jgi:hypothetical protein